MPLWAILSILAGFFVALSDALNKKYLSSQGAYVMLFARTFGSLPFLIPVFLYFLLTKKALAFFTPSFLLVVSLLLSLEMIATVFYMKGIKASPLSASLPFLSFTPVFVVLTGYLILGERVSHAGFAGILLIVLGSYFIHLPERKSLFDPFFRIYKEKGSRYLLITAFIYGITSVLGKKALLLSEPVFFASFYFSALGIAGLIFAKAFGGIRASELCRTSLREVLLVGGTQALMCLSHMLALSLVETAYMIALKRTSILFAVILGYLFFQERYISFRLTGAFLMLLGVVIITFGK